MVPMYSTWELPHFFLHEMLVKLRSVSHFQKLLKRQENFIKKRKLLRKHVLISEVTMLI